MVVHVFESPRGARAGLRFLALAALTAATACSSGSALVPTGSPSPIDKHKELGMDTHLRVGGNGTASPVPGSAAASATGQ
ncbi:hypothetical protein [Streptomyces sp. NPDC059460]|uniref:hypothetical protein n=1 Tax=Streptomyces sp. NPDC059460 TaxID=3346840 RepID=UPI0036956342